jgi:hypothetical protein
MAMSSKTKKTKQLGPVDRDLLRAAFVDRNRKMVAMQPDSLKLDWETSAAFDEGM